MSKLRGVVLSLTLGIGLASVSPAFADHEGDDPQTEARTLTGTLVSRGTAEVVLKDKEGTSHRIRVDDRTRYVWSERSELRDFAPGATVRAEYEAKEQPVATAVWILSPPSRR